MPTFLIILSIGLSIAVLAMFLVVIKQLKQLRDTTSGEQTNKSVLELIKMTQQELTATRKEISENVSRNTEMVQSNLIKTNQVINERLDKATEVIMGVNKELGKMHELGRHITELQDFLRSPKLRGNLGEQVLRDLLEQYFSRDHFDIQYRFNDGQIVDAVLHTDKGIIPIDAKFPMENFQKMVKSVSEDEKEACLHEFGKDIKKHIKDISKKYILPAEGTLDFAIMYIPSEVVYYELIQHSVDLTKFAYEHRVFPVSPNSFYYFLKILLIGLEGKKVEAAAARILEVLQAIRKNNEKFSSQLGVLTSHVNNAKNAVDRVNSDYGRLSNQIDQVQLLKEE